MLISSIIILQIGLFVITSGSKPKNELNLKNRSAVFYPVETFSKNKELGC